MFFFSARIIKIIYIHISNKNFHRHIYLETSSSEDDEDDVILSRKSTNPRGAAMWNGIKVEKVEKLPFDINGKKVFELSSNGSGSRMS